MEAMPRCYQRRGTISAIRKQGGWWDGKLCHCWQGQSKFCCVMLCLSQQHAWMELWCVQVQVYCSNIQGRGNSLSSFENLSEETSVSKKTCSRVVPAPHLICQAMQETHQTSMRCSSAACLLSQTQATAAAGSSQSVGYAPMTSFVCVSLQLGRASAVAA